VDTAGGTVFEESERGFGKQKLADPQSLQVVSDVKVV
jgi:hypothetical protein